MKSHRASFFLSPLLGLLVLGFAGAAHAQVALTWARVEVLRNQVQIIPEGQRARSARLSELLSIGDALRTANRSRAELRFNDGSLARIGARAQFQFTPNTRNFQLSNGTMLLLIPPERGRTTIQTPNAVTGIHGSALFIRFIPETHTTVIGALTNNPAGPMMAYNQEGSQQQPLYAGQLVSIQGNDIGPVFNFDLQTFYDTSGLVEGLNLSEPTPIDETQTPPENAMTPALSAVRQEMIEALEAQGSFNQAPVIENPSFLSVPTNANTGQDLTVENSQPLKIVNFEDSPAAARFLSEPMAATTSTTTSGRDQGRDQAETVSPTSSTELPSEAPSVTSSIEFESSVSATLNPESTSLESPPSSSSGNPAIPPGLIDNPTVTTTSTPDTTNTPLGLTDNPATTATPPGIVENPGLDNPGLTNNPATPPGLIDNPGQGNAP